MARNTVVYGISSSRALAEMAVDGLLTAGFRNEDISILMLDNVGTKDFVYKKQAKVPEGTVTGWALGGTLGSLAGMGALAIPGLGPFIAAGPIMAILAGIGSGGVIGGVIGAFVGMGIPEYEAKRYEGRIKEGGILLSVHCDGDWMIKAKEVLKHYGVEEISSTSEASADYLKDDKAAEARTTKRVV